MRSRFEVEATSTIGALQLESVSVNILNLDSFDVLVVDELNGRYRVSIKSNQLPHACLKCGSLSELYRFGNRERDFFDLPMHGRRVTLHAFIQRFRCRDCGATFYEDPPDLDAKRFATTRFIGYVWPEALKRTFVSVANAFPCLRLANAH